MDHKKNDDECKIMQSRFLDPVNLLKVKRYHFKTRFYMNATSKILIKNTLLYLLILVKYAHMNTLACCIN